MKVKMILGLFRRPIRFEIVFIFVLLNARSATGSLLLCVKLPGFPTQKQVDHTLDHRGLWFQADHTLDHI